VHDLLVSLLSTLSSQCPTQCGHKDHCDSICPHPLITTNPRQTLRLHPCQSDFFSGWRHGAESEIFQLLVEKQPLSTVRQKRADKKFPDSRSMVLSAISPLIAFQKRKQKRIQLCLATVKKMC
jgi:hypothetical protein